MENRTLPGTPWKLPTASAHPLTLLLSWAFLARMHPGGGAAMGGVAGRSGRMKASTVKSEPAAPMVARSVADGTETYEPPPAVKKRNERRNRPGWPGVTFLGVPGWPLPVTWTSDRKSAPDGTETYEPPPAVKKRNERRNRPGWPGVTFLGVPGWPLPVTWTSRASITVVRA